MSDAEKMLKLSDRQKVIIAGMLLGDRELRTGEYDEEQAAEYVEMLDQGSLENVDRDHCIEVDEDWPEVKRVEGMRTSLSDDDNSSDDYDYMVVFEDCCVHLTLHFPEYGDEECDGSLGRMSIHPASEADAVWDRIQQNFVNAAVDAVMSRLPQGEGFDRLLRAAAEAQARKMTPSAAFR